MKLFDSHAHLDMGETSRGLDAVLGRAWDAGLVGVLAVAGASKVGRYGETIEIAETNRRIWVAAGIHPHAASDASQDALDKLRFVLDHERVVALGEIGLDYYREYSEPADQRRAFIRQIRMARDARLPMVVHTRDADHDTAAILRDEGANEIGGVFHCFSSTSELASIAIGLGFFLSFSGAITFPKSDELREVASEVPADRIMAETDSPFLSPLPYRGERNEPARVLHVVEKLAEIRAVEIDEMAETTTQNACICFGIDID